MLFQTGGGGSNISVANLHRLTVIGEDGKPIYTFKATVTVPSIMNLLLAH